MTMQLGKRSCPIWSGGNGVPMNGLIVCSRMYECEGVNGRSLSSDLSTEPLCQPFMPIVTVTYGHQLDCSGSLSHRVDETELTDAILVQPREFQLKWCAPFRCCSNGTNSGSEQLCEVGV